MTNHNDELKLPECKYCGGENVMRAYHDPSIPARFNVRCVSKNKLPECNPIQSPFQTRQIAIDKYIRANNALVIKDIEHGDNFLTDAEVKEIYEDYKNNTPDDGDLEALRWFNEQMDTMLDVFFSDTNRTSQHEFDEGNKHIETIRQALSKSSVDKPEKPHTIKCSCGVIFTSRTKMVNLDDVVEKLEEVLK